MLKQRLTELRKKKKLTQEELSKLIGIPRSTYSNYENGKREPDFETAKIIAHFYQITVDELLGEEIKKPIISDRHKLKVIELLEERGFDFSNPHAVERLGELMDIINKFPGK